MGWPFASDNQAGVHPSVLDAIVDANRGDAPAYGADAWTARARHLLRCEFAEDAEIAFVFTGTASNVLALQCLLRPHEAVITATTAHLNVDECGAPERFLGTKLLAVPAPDGKLTPELVDLHTRNWNDVHRVQPRVVSISQPTEFGACYTVAELQSLVEHVHALGMRVHVDGARLANAAAALGCELAATTSAVGVDLLSFGGTKNGLAGAEAVVAFDADLARTLPFMQKQSMQLASKMRFISAQFVALFSDRLWWRNATHANEMANRLANGLQGIGSIKLTRRQETNAVFAALPAAAIDELREKYPFFVWDAEAGEVRWMTAWDTPPDDVDEFLDALAHADP
jgi:threonine aldolase